MARFCCVCCDYKPLNLFYKVSCNTDGLSYWCKDCWRDRWNELNAKNHYQRKHHLRKRSAGYYQRAYQRKKAIPGWYEKHKGDMREAYYKRLGREAEKSVAEIYKPIVPTDFSLSFD